jgi:hypothetical protein
MRIAFEREKWARETEMQQEERRRFWDLLLKWQPQDVNNNNSRGGGSDCCHRVASRVPINGGEEVQEEGNL